MRILGRTAIMMGDKDGNVSAPTGVAVDIEARGKCVRVPQCATEGGGAVTADPADGGDEGAVCNAAAWT